MKVKIFLAISFIIVIIMAILNHALFQSFSIIWGAVCVAYAISPFFVAWRVERTSMAVFYNEYFSLKNTKWKASLVYLVLTVLIFTVLSILIDISFGSLSYFTGEANVFDVFAISVYSVPTYLIAVAVNIVGLLILGSLIGVANTIFEEIAWRGFLTKHLACPNLLKPLFIGLLWTVWILPLRQSFDLDQILWLFLQNIILSYYLDVIKMATKSVWTGAMIRGIFNANYIIPLFLIDSKLETLSLFMTVMLILLICYKKYNKAD